MAAAALVIHGTGKKTSPPTLDERRIADFFREGPLRASRSLSNASLVQALKPASSVLGFLNLPIHPIRFWLKSFLGIGFTVCRRTSERGSVLFLAPVPLVRRPSRLLCYPEALGLLLETV